MIATTTQKNRTTTPKKKYKPLGDSHIPQDIFAACCNYADFDYMMGMDCVNYRQLYTATGFSPIPKIDAKRQERQLQTQGRYMIRHIESV